MAATVHQLTSEHVATFQVVVTVAKRANGEFHALLTPQFLAGLGGEVGEPTDARGPTPSAAAEKALVTFMEKGGLT